MRRSLSDRVERPAFAGRRWLLPSWALLALVLVSPLAAQEVPTAEGFEDSVGVETATDSLVGAAVSVGSGDASLDLHLSDGRTVELELAGGEVRADGESLGRYDEGGALERSWRDLLEEAAMASTAELPALLRQWQPPAGSGALGDSLDRRLEEALAGVGGRMATATAPAEDSIDKLLARVRELEARGSERIVIDRGWNMPDAVENFLEGLANLFGLIVWFGVLFGVGAALVFFGDGRLERVSGTVLTEPLRSALIGLAGAFLAIPFYVLVMLALVISVLGIPLVIAWAPLFPMLVMLAGLAGWIAVAYGAGDTMIRRKLSQRPRFEHAGAFRSLALGIALLLSPFAVSALFQMTSLLQGLGDLVFVLGILANAIVAAIGFGAVLVRGRDAMDRYRERRAVRRRARLEQQTQESSNV